MLPTSGFYGRFAKPFHCLVTLKFCDYFHPSCSLCFVVPKLKDAFFIWSRWNIFSYISAAAFSDLPGLNMLKDCRKIEFFDALENECWEVEDLVQSCPFEVGFDIAPPTVTLCVSGGLLLCGVCCFWAACLACATRACSRIGIFLGVCPVPSCLSF